MARYEMGMSLDYPAKWTAVDAIREIFQNALDEEVQNPENKWYFNYDRENSILQIGNKLSKLDKKTLLLGVSGKRDDDRTIGQHGEGYKVGINVLLREGLGVTVYNYSEKEVWHAKVINSRRYKQEVAVFDIEKYYIKSVPEQSLIFEITGVSEKLYNEVKEKNLWLQSDLGEVRQCGELGRVLLDPKYSGKVFVRGLYVCTREFLTWGYDLSPELLQLDRDRSLVDSFDLKFSLGKVISTSNDVDFVDKAKDTPDGEYIRFANPSTVVQDVCDREYIRFKEKHGSHAVPCTSEEDYNKLRSHGYSAVLLSNNSYYYVSHSKSFEESTVNVDELPSLSESLEKWVNKVMQYIPKELKSEGTKILQEVKQSLGD